ncbi:oligosaccharyl transferase STT3 [Gregarina niphandrodes]|uniref:dolichyl-diphosphooligosaccharide--protein glycotransferase n=1 Tax=Gregarina niphandrodes TaxID=110365 RepID=A0A023B6K3_GRENI|nr:oligosaccharyl transferase STT3 [Gregarina niphandrodes]EZG66584.1 oligosaccharyl transferase STT3 [Gregarina niphandrodes]|eukprot:XP_011130593.1 oligosaccharyl transferase STT3 [Gregarina niphandrodes]
MKEYIKWSALSCVCLLAFGCRVFSVLRFESVIHEFDPYFNYRTTKYLRDHGFHEFWNWFDESAWYPLGRVVGQTLFPGLMITATVLWNLAQKAGIMLDIREVCVFTAPLFSMGTAFATYKLTTVASNSVPAGLFAALIIAICPSYLSRSTAGGFDNEAIAIFTMVLSFYTFLRACRKGNLASVVLACLAYFYMVTVWGGYVFITNCVAGYVLCVTAINSLDDKMWLAYMGWYTLGTMWCFNIPFVGVGAVKSAEHLSSHVVFVVLAVWKLMQLQMFMKNSELCRSLLGARRTVLAACFGGLTALAVLVVSRGWSRFSGRSMTLLDPSYATKNVPIIASISEHQPPIWSVFHTELGPGFVFCPVGIFLALAQNERKHLWFLGVYAVLAAYFSAVMIRLTLVLAPAYACTAGVAIAHTLAHCADTLKTIQSDQDKSIADDNEQTADCNRQASSTQDVSAQDVSAQEVRTQEVSAQEVRTQEARTQPTTTLPAEKDENKLYDNGRKLRKNKRQAANTAGNNAATVSVAATASVATKTTAKTTTKITAKGTLASGTTTGEVVVLKMNKCVAVGVVAFVLLVLFRVVTLGVFSAAALYSNPSIVTAAQLRNGGTLMIDDLREAFQWMAQNTHPESKLLSWWDYGYQAAYMADRSVIVDNNTWNTTHIATVGLALASDQDKAYDIVQSLDADYVFVLFGGVTRYSGDDLNKFVWIIRIASREFPDCPTEEEFMSPYTGGYEVGEQASPTLRSSLMYLLSYHNFHRNQQTQGQDILRASEIPKTLPLKHFTEAYTTSSYMVRIYRVNSPRQR